MLQLMKLELKKIKLSRYLNGFFVGNLIVMVFVALLVLVASTDQEGLTEYSDFSSVLMMIDIVIRAVFIINSSVILNRLTIDEYKERTVLLMFSYPVDRKKLFVSKLLLVFIHTVGSMTFCTVFFTGILTFIFGKINVIPGVNMACFLNNMKYSLLSIITCGFVSLVPFYFGMRKKSTSNTIIVSVILAVALAQSSGMLGTRTDIIRLLIIGAVSLLIVVYTMLVKLNQLEDRDV